MEPQNFLPQPKDLFAMGTAAAEPKMVIPAEPEAVHFVVVPSGYVVQKIDTDHLRTRPRRVAARADFFDVESFVRYVNAFKRPETQLFAVITESGITAAAIIDYHRPHAEPAFGEHIVSFEPRLAPEWKTWVGKFGKKMNQTEFIEFIEAADADFRLRPGRRIARGGIGGCAGARGDARSRRSRRGNRNRAGRSPADWRWQMIDRTPAQLADEHAAIADAAREIAADEESFVAEFRRLIRRRLRGEISAEQFFAGNLSLHITYGRPGYSVEQYERDMADHHERIERRERRAKLDAALRGKGGA